MCVYVCVLSGCVFPISLDCIDSHPVFRPEPSVRDIENQQQLQNLFASSAADPDPFIGLIVGWLVGWWVRGFVGGFVG